MGTHPIFESDFDCLTERDRMPDTRRLAYSENTFSYELFAGDTQQEKQLIHEDEGMLIQSNSNCCEDVKRRRTLLKSNSMAVVLATKLTLLANILKRKCQSRAFSARTRWSTSLASPRAKDSRVSLQDGTPRNCPARPTKVFARSPVSEPGILAVSSTLLPVLVKRDTTIVPRSTKRSTISVMDST